MDRARRTTAGRRRTLGASASPQSNSDASLEPHRPSASPVMVHATNTPQTQTAPQGRRANSKTLQQQSFTFSTPGPNRGQNLRKRSKTMDDYNMPEEDFENNGSPKKGGHILRKRARVDYTLEQIDDEVEVPSSTSARNKKRKSEVTYESEDLYGSGLKRRGASLDADTPSSRRRNPARKTSEMRAYKEEIDEDENDIQDTIEVGIPCSDDEKSDHDHIDHPNTSTSNHSTAETPQKSKSNGAPHPDSAHADHPAEKLNGTTTPAKGADSPINKIASDESIANEIQDTENHVADDGEIEPIEPQVKFRDSFKMSEDQPSTQTGSKLICDTLKAQSGREHPDEGKLSPVSPTAPNHPVLSINGDGKADDESKGLTESSPQLSEEQAPLESSVKQTDEDKGEPQSPKGQSISPPTQLHDTSDVPNVDITEPPSTAPEDESANAASPKPITQDLVQSPSSLAPEPSGTDSTQIITGEIQPGESADAAIESASPQSTQAQDSQDRPETSSTMSEPVQAIHFKPQPRPIGRWAHLTPYLDGEFICYPEKKSSVEDEAVTSEYQTPEDKDAVNDMEPMVDDIDDMPDVAGIEVPTPALNTPTRGSPVPESVDPTVPNSPAPGGEDGYDVDVSESQEPPDRRRIFRYRKVRNAEEYISALENFEDMQSGELFELLDAINLSMVEWQNEWNSLGKVVDDYENSLRRRAADAKYESRTRNFHQHGTNYEEPEFAVKGYKAKDKDVMSETRYLQSQDRVMAAAYGFEYDPHPSKIGRQNPQAQQSGIMTRGRSLRNQPKPTAKATEADEVTGKRQRKPVQVFDTATQDVSRSSTPVPTRGRRRRTVNENDDMQLTAASSFNGEANSDDEGLDAKRRKRVPRQQQQQQQKAAVPSIVEELAPQPPAIEEPSVRDTPSRSGRRARVKPVKYDDDNSSYQFVDEEPQEEPKQPRRRHLLTLKIPKSKNSSEPSSAITDNGDSRPSTASSESSSHTAESSYSFRPKRQKRFRDDPDDDDETNQAPKKRAKRGGDEVPTPIESVASDAQQGMSRKIHKIKVVRTTPASRKGTPSSLPNVDEADEPQKDYKSMTKSEKMSASMKSRWANGNMAGAVEKRKATLAAKKAAQAVADQRGGLIAPKLKATKLTKKESIEDGSLPAFSMNDWDPHAH